MPETFTPQQHLKNQVALSIMMRPTACTGCTSYIDSFNSVWLLAICICILFESFRCCPSEAAITGIACIDRKLFLCFHECVIVKVYRTTELQSTYVDVRIPELREPMDMAASEGSRTVFILDNADPSSFVHTLPATLCNYTRWRVGQAGRSLSVTSREAILVVCTEAQLILEFTATGSKLKTILLPVAHPMHALESCDWLIVSHVLRLTMTLE